MGDGVLLNLDLCRHHRDFQGQFLLGSAHRELVGGPLLVEVREGEDSDPIGIRLGFYRIPCRRQGLKGDRLAAYRGALEVPHTDGDRYLVTEIAEERRRDLHIKSAGGLKVEECRGRVVWAPGDGRHQLHCGLPGDVCGCLVGELCFSVLVRCEAPFLDGSRAVQDRHLRQLSDDGFPRAAKGPQLQVSDLTRREVLRGDVEF